MTEKEALAVLKHELGPDPELTAIEALAVLRAAVEKLQKFVDAISLVKSDPDIELAFSKKERKELPK